MTTYGCEFLNGVVITLDAKGRQAAKAEAEAIARSQGCPSTHVQRTWLYNFRGELVSPKPKVGKRRDCGEAWLFEESK